MTATATGRPIEAAAVLAALEAGTLRAAEPSTDASHGWRVNPDVKSAILALFRDRTETSWTVGPFGFRDRAALPPRDNVDGPWRIVPGGTSIRVGVHLEPGVVVMPPSYINVGAWIGPDTMVDSHVLVGSCAQVGGRVHLAAGVLVGGVLEPPGARPVIVEDEAFVGAGSALLDGVLVGRRAVIGAGVTLTGTSRLYDLVNERVLDSSTAEPLVVPEAAVVVPGTRQVHGDFATRNGLTISTALIVKYRDAGTDARVALEEALR
jgi:2,3,4,5-tetrahydropyridine-2,6-dicarboxylate N-succinyltransferase